MHFSFTILYKTNLPICNIKNLLNTFREKNAYTYFILWQSIRKIKNYDIIIGAISLVKSLKSCVMRVI